jgi:hypothetical protein
MKSRVLDVASLIAAALAAAWCASTLEPFDRHGLVVGCSVGALLRFDAFWLRRETDFATSHRHPRTVIYTALALAVWLVAAWRNASPEWRGMVLAAMSLALLFAARPLGNRVLTFGSYAFAAVGAGWELQTLAVEFDLHGLHQRVGLAPATIAGALLALGAYWERRDNPSPSARDVHPAATFFSLAGLLLWATATCGFTPPEFRAPLLAAEAAVFTVVYYPLRLLELTVFGQLFLLLAQILWLYEATAAHVSRPWWNPASVILITLGLAAWWQRQKTLVLEQPVGRVLRGISALAVVALFYYWLQPHFPDSGWLAFTSLLAILLTAYAALNRYWLLAATGQLFILASVWQFWLQLANGKPEWCLPLAPIAALCLLSFSTLQWLGRHKDTAAPVREPILQIGLAYRVTALVMSLWWVQKYLPARENCWTFALLGVALFTVAGWQRSQELLIFSALYTLAAIARFWLPLDGAPTVYLPNLPALLAVLVQQQFAGRLRDRFCLPRPIHVGAIFAGGISLWLLLSRWILQQPDGIYLTAGWSVLALAFFIAGMAVREREYRWLGLGILACALSRVVLFDVWRLETLYRILSFMALGIVLLVLGFIYNKYQEKIKQWL